MAKMIFVNLPVADLDRAKAFYSAIGFTNEPKFTDETAACMVWSNTIYVMLLTHAKWGEFTTRPIPDPAPVISATLPSSVIFDSPVAFGEARLTGCASTVKQKRRCLHEPAQQDRLRNPLERNIECRLARARPFFFRTCH